MKRKPILLYCCLLSILGAFSSCSKEVVEGPVIPESPQGTAYLSVGVNLESGILTRAGATGIEDEWKIRSIRFVLYSGGLDGSAAVIHDYNTTYASGAWTVIPIANAPANLRIEGPLTAPVITKDFEKLIKQDYRLLVLINHNSEANANLNAIAYNGRTVNTIMSGVNHSMSILSSPIDLSLVGGSKDKNLFDCGIGPGLTALPMEYPAITTNFTTAAFLMSNADGLVFIDEDTGLYPSLEIAQTEPNRTVVNVERAVAKVGLLKGSENKIRNNGNGTYLLMNGAGLIASLTWTTDIISYYWYIVRKQANIAPGLGGGPETSTPNRQYYYAEDANFDGISQLRTGQTHTGTASPAYHFFRVTSADEIRRNWVDNPATTDEQNKLRYEYISENTMQAAEQFEDVATRVLIRVNFVPLKTVGSQVINVGQSYYYYNGYALTHEQLCYYMAYPAAINSLPTALHGLRNLLFDQEVIDEFGFDDGEIIGPIGRAVDPDNPPKEPTVSKTKKGLTYYLHGISYYYIVIRHFTDAESPGESGYGRFGVVRNNVYNVIVDDITGPGYIDIPVPSGRLLRSRSAREDVSNPQNPIYATVDHDIW